MNVDSLFSLTICNGCGDMPHVNRTPRQKPTRSSSAGGHNDDEDRPVAMVMSKSKGRMREEELTLQPYIVRPQNLHEVIHVTTLLFFLFPFYLLLFSSKSA